MYTTKTDSLKSVSKPVKSSKAANARNTFKIEYEDGSIAYRLHKTDVVTFTDHSIILNSGGWRTPTTKERINEFAPTQFRVSQDKGLWHVHTPKGTFDFYDGIEFSLDGQPKKEIKTDVKKIEKLKDQIGKFVAKITKENLPLPNGGDCWLCALRTSEGKTMGELGTGNADHLLQHVKEGYLHGSLLVNAMRAYGYKDEQIPLFYQMKLVSTFRRALRRYLQRNLIPTIATK